MHEIYAVNKQNLSSYCCFRLTLFREVEKHTMIDNVTVTLTLVYLYSLYAYHTRISHVRLTNNAYLHVRLFQYK